jgi:hypothetical protein
LVARVIYFVIYLKFKVNESGGWGIEEGIHRTPSGESGRAGDVNTNRPPSLEKIEIVEYGTRIVVITSTTSLMGDENKPIEIIIGKPI